MTYRVLIVDDEYYIRQRVKLCIPWEDYGFKCVAEARSVEDALDYFSSNQVDLILVDISMPGRNGLELIREARTLYPRINFIILSGFSTFAYAKEALKYDVAEYLLKPINTEELIRALSSIKQRLDHQSEDDALKQEFRYFKEMHQLSENNLFFRDLLSDRLLTSSDLSPYGLVQNKSYLLFIADIPDVATASHMSSCSRRLKLRNIILEFLAPYDVAYVCTDYHDRQVFVCNLALIKRQPHELLTAVEQVAIEQLQLPFICGYHEATSGTAEQFRIAYRLAMNFFLFRAIYGRALDEKSPATISDSMSMKELQKLEERLRICLYAENRSGVSLDLKEIFCLLRPRNTPYSDFGRRTIWNIYNCNTICRQQGTELSL